MRYSVEDGELIAKGEWPTTRKGALAESIKKWKWLVKWHFEHPKSGALLADSMSCALCNLYIGDDCVDCPVRKCTGQPQCCDTPYFRYAGEKRPLWTSA